jgi:chromosome segregation ATPase
VSYAEIEAAARKLMADGGYPSVAAVRRELKRGSTTTIARAMTRFWKDQAALNSGDPVALNRLPPELADAAVAQWEQALRLAQQTATYEDNAARAQLEQLRRETDARVRSVELREKEWDMAARVRERALADARDHINALMKALATDRAELRARDVRIADLDSQLEAYRQQLATLVTRAVTRTQQTKIKQPKRLATTAANRHTRTKKRAPSTRSSRKSKSASGRSIPRNRRR